MATTRTLFKTQHGSHLYGLATPSSDLDYYTVFDYPWIKYRPKKQVFQILDGDFDTTETSFDRFNNMCWNGVPQALESLFAPEEFWMEHDDSWYDKREFISNNLRFHKDTIYDTYRRTALNFFALDNFKKNRHAFRLLVNIQEFKNTGSFTPKLNDKQREEITRIADLPRSRREDIFKDIFFSTFN